MSKTTIKPVNIDPWENANSQLSMVIALLNDFFNLHLLGRDKAHLQDSLMGIISLLCSIVDESEKDFNKAWLTQLDNEKAAS